MKLTVGSVYGNRPRAQEYRTPLCLKSSTQNYFNYWYANAYNRSYDSLKNFQIFPIGDIVFFYFFRINQLNIKFRFCNHQKAYPLLKTRRLIDVSIDKIRPGDDKKVRKGKGREGTQSHNTLYFSYLWCCCCLLAGQPEVHKKQRPPITPRKPKPAAAAAAVEPSSSALYSLSSLSSAVTDSASGKLHFYCLTSVDLETLLH